MGRLKLAMGHWGFSWNTSFCRKIRQKMVPFFYFFVFLNGTTLRKTFKHTFQQRLPGLSAEMAYNSMLALFPAILAIVTAIALFEDSIQSLLLHSPSQVKVQDNSLQLILRQLAIQLKIIAPDLVWTLLKNFVAEISEAKSKSLFSVSFAAAIWVSSSALNAAMNALDQIHQIPLPKRRPFWQAKIVALLLTLGSIFLLALASFLVLVGDVIVQFTVRTIQTIPFKESTAGAYFLLTSWRLLSFPFAFAIVIIAFALIYRFGPSIWRKETPIFPGAFLAAVSWAGLSGLFRLYVNNFGNYNKVYGAVGAVIVLMLWLYLSSLVMLIGGQLNVTVGRIMRATTLSQSKKQKVLDNSFN